MKIVMFKTICQFVLLLFYRHIIVFMKHFLISCKLHAPLQNLSKILLELYILAFIWLKDLLYYESKYQL